MLPQAALGSIVGSIRNSNEDTASIYLSPLDRVPACTLLLVADGSPEPAGAAGTGRAAGELAIKTIYEALQTLLLQPSLEPRLSGEHLAKQFQSAGTRANAALYTHQGDL